jgi:hypothetical protein
MKLWEKRTIKVSDRDGTLRAYRAYRATRTKTIPALGVVSSAMKNVVWKG